MLKDTTIPSGGVLPLIHPELLPRKKTTNTPPVVNRPISPPVKTAAAKVKAVKPTPVVKVAKITAPSPAKGGKGKGKASKVIHVQKLIKTRPLLTHQFPFH